LIPGVTVAGTQVTQLDIRDFRGIVSYDPSEFLLTARAGTTIAEIQESLSRNGQFLPFDPLFVGAEATLGGSIASGISGPDRLLFGGIRDFIMEIAMMDGLGNVVRGGGKVVKNAAGFDTPKMMVGSYGRLGIILEATLKVFPVPQAWATLVLENASLQTAVQLSQRILSKSFPIAGVDLNADNQLTVRLAGPASSLQASAEKIESLVQRKALILLDQHHAQRRRLLSHWLESQLSPEMVLARVALSPRDLESLSRLLTELELKDYLLCAAGCNAWVKLPLANLQGFSDGLRQISLSGIVVCGRSEAAALGDCRWQQMAARIQHAVDPKGRFVAWGVPTPASH